MIKFLSIMFSNNNKSENNNILFVVNDSDFKQNENTSRLRKKNQMTIPGLNNN